MPVMVSVAPQFWHLRLSMIFSGLGINWGWGMGSSCFRRERYRALSHRRLAHRAESVMAHVQHLSFESLVKMDHFQKEPLLDLRRTTGAHGGVERGQYVKEQIGNPAQTECPLWVKSGQTVPDRNLTCPLLSESGQNGASARMTLGANRSGIAHLV
jgi:hypothetical protein